MPPPVTSGMDIPAVRQMAQQMQQAGDQVRDIGTRITQLVQNTPWLGPDRQRFEQEWQQRNQQLTQIAQALLDASRVATQNAQQQEQTSNA